MVPKPVNFKIPKLPNCQRMAGHLNEVYLRVRTKISPNKDEDISEQGRRYLRIRTEISPYPCSGIPIGKQSNEIKD